MVFQKMPYFLQHFAKNLVKTLQCYEKKSAARQAVKLAGKSEFGWLVSNEKVKNRI